MFKFMVSMLVGCAALLWVSTSAVAQSESPDYEGWTAEEIGRDLARRAQEGDPEAEFFILLTVANEGHAGAQHNIGMFYLIGHGVEVDHTQAARWLYKASVQGAADSQFFLSSLYYDGKGVAKDVDMAHMWAAISDYNGYEHAKELKMDIQGWMGFSSIGESHQRADVCLASEYADCGPGLPDPLLWSD